MIADIKRSRTLKNHEILNLENYFSNLNFISVFYWYLIVVSILLFFKMQSSNNVTNQGVVYRTAEERSNPDLVDVELANLSSDAK